MIHIRKHDVTVIVKRGVVVGAFGMLLIAVPRRRIAHVQEQLSPILPPELLWRVGPLKFWDWLTVRGVKWYSIDS